MGEIVSAKNHEQGSLRKKSSDAKMGSVFMLMEKGKQFMGE